MCVLMFKSSHGPDAFDMSISILIFYDGCCLKIYQFDDVRAICA